MSEGANICRQIRDRGRGEGGASTFSAEFRGGLRATLTVSMKGVRCDWKPDVPRNIKGVDRDALLEAYRVWRDECLTEFARSQGLTIKTVRVGGIDCISFYGPESLR